MARRAFLFPGQGSQFVGMGKDLAERYPEAAAVISAADAALGFPLSKLMWDGPEPELTQTQNVQPAIFTVSAAAYTVIERRSGIRPAAVAGHSLGEYSALFTAGVISFEDGVRLVRRRGELMATCTEQGAMLAIVAENPLSVWERLRERLQPGPRDLNVANYNSEGQIVLSGTVEAIQAAAGAAKEAGAKLAVPLKVSGAFHSPLMQSAVSPFTEALVRVPFANPVCEFIPNITAQPERDPERICELLKEQLTGSVQWHGTIQYMIAAGIRDFIEVGPGKVLSTMLKRSAKDMQLTLRSAGTADEIELFLKSDNA